jgi:hypothetical protein
MFSHGGANLAMGVLHVAALSFQSACPAILFTGLGHGQTWPGLGASNPSAALPAASSACDKPRLRFILFP